MTIIRCPICDEFIEGDGEDALTIMLREHLSSAHDILESGEVLSSIEMLRHRPRLWEEMKRGAVPVERDVGEDVEESLLCPLCGERMYGHDGDELSSRLKAHMRTVHNMKTTRMPVTKR